MAILGLVGLVGCGSSGSGSHYTAAEQQPTTQTTVYSGGGDVDIQDVDIGTNGTYIDGNGNIVAGGNISAGGAIGEGHNGDFQDDISDDDDIQDDMTPAECKRAGGFYCNIEKRCLGRTGAGASCPGK